MVPYRPKKVLIHEQSWHDSATHEILGRLQGIQTHTIRSADLLRVDLWQAATDSDPKNTLILTRYPGSFLKNCQGSGAEICCGYLIVSYAWNCHLDCTYCVLQSYLSTDALVVFTNIEQLLSELEHTLVRYPNLRFRIGTGELADSLALDSLTHYTRRLVTLFASHPNGILELKTKSDQIGNLRDLDHGGRTVVSWSMNAKPICASEESKASSFDERLAAALQCQKWGYKLGFHFDPLIYYEGWQEDYRQAVEQIFNTIDPSKVAWVSLGALRFTPHLRDVIRQRHPQSKIPYGEFVPGHHGKLRYFRPIREEMYRKIGSWIRAVAPDVFVYLCMESRVVWQRSFNHQPPTTADLCWKLSTRC